MYLITLIACLFSASVFADDFDKAKPGAKPVGYDANNQPIYKLIDFESRFNGGLSPMVYQGTKSIDGEFPELGFLGFCTATAVGSRVILTAGHCIKNGQRIKWKMRKNQIEYQGTCTKHPQYNDNTVFNDYAFCILDIELPKDSIFASFNISGGPSKGEEALLNGYGAPFLGSHYWGKAEISGTQGQDISTCSGANLGGGDSGGPFFKWTTDRKDPSKHVIDGVNSRKGGNCSYFNSTSHPNFISWARPFAEKNSLFICGVNSECNAPPSDPNKCKEERGSVAWISKELGIANDQLKLCLSKP